MISPDIQSLLAAYRSGGLKPTELMESIYSRIEAARAHPVFISIVDREAALERARTLETQDPTKVPLFGIPFAVKDNIDVAGMPTTAGCPAYAYTPERSAGVVDRLLDAGAILVGKTNLDQFATGLVGTRSPYGACSSVFDERYISGGSSSGSAVTVARALVSFALGTDTAGSGRVPAAFNNIVGLKPTRGWIGGSGVVPACRSLDCVSVFALTCADAAEVLRCARGNDPSDPYSRSVRTGEGAAPWLGGSFRFGCPGDDQLEFFGDAEAERLYREAIEELTRLGGKPVTIDYAPFRECAQLLYSGPWIAERVAAVGEFIEANQESTDPTVASIILGAKGRNADDAFRGMYELERLRARTAAEWARMDFMLLPTAPTIYTIDEVRADPVRLNSNLGYYTNFVNLLELAAVAIPAGFRANGLPLGVSLIGPAFSDEALLAMADLLHRSLVDQLGGTSHLLADTPPLSLKGAPGCTEVAVVGAHLTGQPLNWQLTDRGGRFVRACRTAPGYRLFALDGTVPPKPGLVRDSTFAGSGIELEVWAIPDHEFGSFVREVPAPLGIGNATLEDGSTVKCFICEPYAIAGSADISHFGGWRAYLAAKAAGKAVTTA